MSENFITPIIIHGEGLTQFTRAGLEERLGVLGLQVAVPILPQHRETILGVIELHQEQGRLPVVFDESEFRAFASRDFSSAVAGKTWHHVCRLGFSFPLTPTGIANGRSLQDKIAFFYPPSLLALDAISGYEKGFAMYGSLRTDPELTAGSHPDAVSAQKLVENGIFRDHPTIGGKCVDLLRQFCAHVLGPSRG